MAKRKKRKSTGRRSGGKRMRGSSSQDAIMMVLGGVLGGIATNFIAGKVGFLQSKIGSFIPLALGGIMAWKIGMPFMKGVGVGMAVSGGSGVAKNFGLLAGIGATRNFSRVQPQMNGFRQVPKIGQAFPKPPTVGRPDMSRVYAGVYN